MKVVDPIDAGIHYQKSELRNHYNEIIHQLDKEDKLFIEDRRSGLVAVMISYKLYKGVLRSLRQIEEMQDRLDYQTALLRESEGQKPIPSAEFRKLLKTLTKRP